MLVFIISFVFFAIELPDGQVRNCRNVWAVWYEFMSKRQFVWTNYFGPKSFIKYAIFAAGIFGITAIAIVSANSTNRDVKSNINFDGITEQVNENQRLSQEIGDFLEKYSYR